MQATFDLTLDGAMNRLQLKGRRQGDYLMRSEKRPGGGSSGGRRPRKPKRSWPYTLLTLLLLLILYPVGLIMLWLRKFRASAAFKMALSLITCLIYIILVAFALTVEVDNPTYQSAQASARQVFERFGDSSRDIVKDVEAKFVNFPKTLGQVTYQTIETARDGLVFAVGTVHKNVNSFADNIGIAGLNASKSVLQQVQDKVNEVVSSPSPSPEPSSTPAPTMTAEPTPAPVMAWFNEAENVYHLEESCDPMALNSIELSEAIERGLRPCPVCAPSGEDEPSTEEPTSEPSPEVSDSPEPTMRPTDNATPTITPLITDEPTAKPSEAPSASPEIQARLASPDVIIEPTFLPTDEPEQATASPTESPTPQVSDIPTIAPTVALTLAPSTTPAETLTERPTEEPAYTQAPSSLPLPEPLHTPAPESDPSPAATVTPTPAPPETEAPTSTLTVAPTETPEPTPTPIPTVAPTPIPLPAIKPIAEATVWHSPHGTSYHTWAECRGMKNAAEYTLASSIEDGFKKCDTCDSPDPALLTTPMVVWCSPNKVYHITDECDAFTAPWVARTMAQAIEEGYVGCDVCKSILFNPDGTAKIVNGETLAPAMPVRETPTPQPADNG